MQRAKSDLSLPPTARVGILGGSFDPPHAGHVHISREAIKRFHLDRVVWLVSPGNPLKAHAPAPLAQRCAVARQMLHDPRIRVSRFEADHGTRYTAASLRRLRRVFPQVRFVWLMGADNLAQFHRWQDWQEIMSSVPVGVIARPGQRIAARASRASKVYRQAKLPARAAKLLPGCAAPAWCFVNVPMRDLSSTRLRAERGWGSASATKGFAYATPDKT